MAYTIVPQRQGGQIFKITEINNIFSNLILRTHYKAVLLRLHYLLIIMLNPNPQFIFAQEFSSKNIQVFQYIFQNEYWNDVFILPRLKKKCVAFMSQLNFSLDL